MSSDITIIIDDSVFFDEPPFNGDTGGWIVDFNSTDFPSAYNTTVVIPDATPFGTGAYTLDFDGISLSLFGVTPPTEFNQTFGVIATSNVTQINNPKRYPSQTYPTPSRGGQFYASPSLPSSGHIKLGLTGIRALALDYILVTVGDSTDLQGQTILVDDSSNEITWRGNWTEKSNYTIPVQCSLPMSPKSSDGFHDFLADISPHGNGSHISNTVGDSFTFRFAGTSLSISGITPSSPDTHYLLEMNFTLDGNTTTQTFTHEAGVALGPHFIYFTSPTLQPGNHTIQATITDIAGDSAANIDYITYQPSFLTARDKPDFSSVSTNSTPTGSMGLVPTTSETSTPNPSNGGAIAGGVVGGCVLMALIGIGIWLACRRRKTGRQPPLSVNEPFTLPSPLNGRNVMSAKGSGQLAPSASAILPEAEARPEGSSVEQQQLRGDSGIENQMREMRLHMNMLTREMRMHMAPPSYGSNEVPDRTPVN